MIGLEQGVAGMLGYSAVLLQQITSSNGAARLCFTSQAKSSNKSGFSVICWHLIQPCATTRVTGAKLRHLLGVVEHTPPVVVVK